MITGGDWNPKHILEKLLDQVDVLKSELKKEQEARALLAGLVIDNENMADGKYTSRIISESLLLLLFLVLPWLPLLPLLLASASIFDGS
jgi:hypothetical protein